MERDDNESRRSLPLQSENDVTDNIFIADNSVTGNDPLKRTRWEEMDLPQIGVGSYNSHPHYFLRGHSISAPYQAKQQYVQNDTLDGEHRSGLNNLSMVNLKDSVANPSAGLVRDCSFANPGDQENISVVGLHIQNEFIQTISNAGCASSSSSVPFRHNPRLSVPTSVIYTGMANNMGPPRLDSEEQMNNLINTLERSPESSRGKASMSNDHYREPLRFRRELTGGLSQSSSCFSNQGMSMLPSQAEKKQIFSHPVSVSCSMATQSENSKPDERRNDHKRKLSMIDLVDLSPRQDPQSKGWCSESRQEGTGGSRIPRSQSSTSGHVVSIDTTNVPLLQNQDGFSGNRITLNRGNLSVQHESNSNDTGSSSSGLSHDFHLARRFEVPNHAQQESGFRSNLDPSIAAPNSHTLYSRDVLYLEQPIQESVSLRGQNLCSNRTTSNLATAEPMSHYNRDAMATSRFSVRERSPNRNVNRRNGIPSMVSRGVRRVAWNDVATSGHVPNASIARMSNISEARTLANSLSYNPSSNIVNGNLNFLRPAIPASNLMTSPWLPRTISSGQHAGSHAALLVNGHSETIPRARIPNILGLPLLNSRMPYGDRRRLLSEILSTLEQASRSDDINFEELVMLDPPFVYRGVDVHDQHRDMRLDVDNMSYEELLALEERIGNVSTGLSNDQISTCLSESKYSSLDAALATLSQESDIKCTVCQEEFVEDDEIGRLDCGHGYHTNCIRQWLSLKNICPICKAPAYSS